MDVGHSSGVGDIGMHKVGKVLQVVLAQFQEYGSCVAELDDAHLDVIAEGVAAHRETGGKVDGKLLVILKL